MVKSKWLFPPTKAAINPIKRGPMLEKLGWLEKKIRNKVAHTGMLERMYAEQFDTNQSDSSDSYDLFRQGDSQSL